MSLTNQDKRFYALLIAIACFFLAALVFWLPEITKAAEPELPSAWQGRACWDRGLDGDTLWVTVPGRNKPVKVRLAWVDTLDKAKALVAVDRQATHGDPRYVYQTVAEFWQAYLRARGWAFVQGKELSAYLHGSDKP